jgi:hypothetical protein
MGTTHPHDHVTIPPPKRSSASVPADQLRRRPTRSAEGARPPRRGKRMLGDLRFAPCAVGGRPGWGSCYGNGPAPCPGRCVGPSWPNRNVQVLAAASANGAWAARYRTAPNRLFCAIRDLTGRAPTRARNRRSALPAPPSGCVSVDDPLAGGRRSCSSQRHPMSRHLRGGRGAPQNWAIGALWPDTGSRRWRARNRRYAWPSQQRRCSHMHGAWASAALSS